MNLHNVLDWSIAALITIRTRILDQGLLSKNSAELVCISNDHFSPYWDPHRAAIYSAGISL